MKGTKKAAQEHTERVKFARDTLKLAAMEYGGRRLDVTRNGNESNVLAAVNAHGILADAAFRYYQAKERLEA